MRTHQFTAAFRTACLMLMRPHILPLPQLTRLRPNSYLLLLLLLLLPHLPMDVCMVSLLPSLLRLPQGQFLHLKRQDGNKNLPDGVDATDTEPPAVNE